MDIKKYTSFFHDGSIFDIQCNKNEILIFMHSAEMDEEDIQDDAILSKENILKGKLHLEGIKKIIENNLLIDSFIMKKEDGGIFRFKIYDNIVQFQITWDSIPFDKEDFSVVEIEAEKIWWENCPDMPDP